jgi:hypothetical protein
MPQEMIGRRLPVKDGDDCYGLLTQAGDYCGPFRPKPECQLSVYYLLPIARDEGVHGEARALHHAESPPHVFREEPDGSLTIRESIGAGRPFYWHGFLTEGRWELTKSKP